METLRADGEFAAEEVNLQADVRYGTEGLLAREQSVGGG
jgi:hypothetical protein